LSDEETPLRAFLRRSASDFQAFYMRIFVFSLKYLWTSQVHIWTFDIHTAVVIEPFMQIIKST